MLYFSTMVKRVLITGACGFLGSHLYEHIMVNTDWYVVTLDRLGETTFNGLDRLKESTHYNKERTTTLTYDLTCPVGRGLKKEIGEVNIIYHVASSSHVDKSIKSPRDFVNNNINVQVTMLDLAVDLLEQGSLELFYQFSTDEVYGTAPNNVYYKEGEAHKPGNPYSASKSSQEMLCRAYANTYKLPVIVSNCMNMIGEKQHAEKFLPKLINAGRFNQTIKIHADPNGVIGTRFYIHARDAASAVLFITKHSKDRLSHINPELGVYNIPGSKEISNLELLKIVSNRMKCHIPYEIVDMDSDRPGVDIRYALDGTKLKQLGWVPPQDIEEKIERIIKWSLKKGNVKWLNT